MQSHLDGLTSVVFDLVGYALSDVYLVSSGKSVYGSGGGGAKVEVKGSVVNLSPSELRCIFTINYPSQSYGYQIADGDALEEWVSFKLSADDNVVRYAVIRYVSS